MRDEKVLKPNVHRSAVAAADTGDQSTIGAAISAEGAIHALVLCEFSNASATASIALALFDYNDSLFCITAKETFTADDSWRNGAAGPYLSPAQIFDLMGAAKYRVLVKTISAGSVNIYSRPLQINEGN